MEHAPRRLRHEPFALHLARRIWLRCRQTQSWADAVTSTQPDTIPDACISERISALTKVSSLTSEDKMSTSLVDRLSRLLRNFGDRLFADTDARARRHGWQVTRRHGGLSRRYRDPRFDSLVRCPSCAGTGGWDAVACGPCGGTGRLILHQPARVQGGAGHA